MNVKTNVGAGGRVVIPAAMRKAAGMRTGDEVILALEDDAIRVMTPLQAARRAQALLRPYLPDDGRRLSDELIAERREEASRE